MKKNVSLFLIVTCLLQVIISSCTNDLDVYDTQSSTTVELNKKNHKITENEAIDIANRFFKTTRGKSDFAVKYVINKDNVAKTRAAGISDTLAYILNRGEEDGFILVASDNRVFPVLAFSETGHFDYKEDESDIVYANFISLLDDYITNESRNDTVVSLPDDFLSKCLAVKPTLVKSWYQRQPYDKYVIQEHPGCPVGCVAVATGQIMVAAKETFHYHDSIYYAYAIRDALKDTTSSPQTRIIGGKPKVYTYDEAIDRVAKLLYWIGKDLNMNYAPDGSGAYSNDALKLIKDLGYDTEKNVLTTYVDSVVINKIFDGNLIYMDGRDFKAGEGHAWVIDGAYCCWLDPFRRIGMLNKFVHCDWGWGGYDNGYYNGSVFTTTYYTFESLRYFAVKKE